MKKILNLLLIGATLLAGACGQISQQQYEGAAAGALVGAVAGTLLDKNDWRGGVIGAGLGAVLGATIAEISSRASREAYISGRPVEYKTTDGRGYYRAEPVGDYYYKDPVTKCRRVAEKIYENGRLVKDVVKEVCESERQERRY